MDWLSFAKGYIAAASGVCLGALLMYCYLKHEGRLKKAGEEDENGST